MQYGETVGDIAKRFGVNPQTVRQWAAQFAPFLSMSANPDKGETRLFDEDDLRVFALIAYMRGKGASFDEIQVSLESGQRGLMMEIASSTGDSQGISAGAYLARVEDLARDLGYTKGELSRVEGELRIEREAHQTTRQSEGEHRERAARAEERARILESVMTRPVEPVTEPRSSVIGRWVLIVGIVVIVALLGVLVFLMMQQGL